MHLLFFPLIFCIPIVSGGNSNVILWDSDTLTVWESVNVDSCRDLGGIAKRGISRISTNGWCIVLYSEYNCTGPVLFVSPKAVDYALTFPVLYPKSIGPCESR